MTHRHPAARSLALLACFISAASLAASVTSLTASPASNSVTLNWAISGSINAQEIYRDTDSNPSGRVRIATPATGTRSYTDTSVTNGTTYWYWIKARQSEDNVWVNSAAASATPTAAATASVTNFRATGGNNVVDLSWTISGSINAQEVYRDTDSNPSGRVRIATPAASARSYPDTSAVNGTAYWYWVKARQSSDNVWVDSVAASATPNNPNSGFWELSGNLGTHDPTIAQESGIWYEFQTGPGIYRKISTNGGTFWDPLPSVLPNGLSWWKTYVPNQSGIDVWAPDVKAYNGRVWMYYAVSTFGSKVSAIGLLSASSLAAGDWRDDGLVIRTTASNDYNAIDPDLTIDAGGSAWLSFGSWNSGIKLTQLNSSMKPTGTLYSIASRSGGIEAPTIIYRNGYYYLFVSTGLCCQGVNSTYQIRYGRSTSITGPYVDKSGVSMMSGGGTLLDGGNSRWIGPGGQDIAGTSVIARHAYDATDNGNAKLLINTLNWSSDNWPQY
ncbi:MAG TPA: glycoside hydrolase family 43 protein [Povalibacter sp.]|nr:glycoside hydrolase family 43 protein [Povalibacter sp.]